jgi:hypothetical protein
MSNEVSYLTVTDVVENEDGSADYTVHLYGRTQKALAETGLRLVLTCAAYGLSIEDAIQSVEDKGKDNSV